MGWTDKWEYNGREWNEMEWREIESGVLFYLII